MRTAAYLPLMALLLAGCVGSDPEPTGSTAMSPGMTHDHNMMDMDPSAAKEMYIVATDVSSQPDTIYKFRPATFTAKLGETLNITLKSAVGDQNPHNLIIDELGVHVGNVNAGETKSVMATASKSGSFKYYCSIGNHRQLGMEGTLTVS